MQVRELAASVPGAISSFWKSVQRGLLAMAALSGMASGALAGTNAWTTIGPFGGQVIDLAFHPTVPATMYAATSGGFYRSTDSGASWQLTTPTRLSDYFRPVALAVGPGGADRVHLVAGYGSTMYSEDRGITLRETNWQISGSTLPTSSPSGWVIAAAADGSAVYYVVNKGVWRSTDGGVTRQLRGNLPGTPDSLVGSLCVDAASPQTVYATTFGGGLFRSTDAGANWSAVFTPVDIGTDGIWTMTVDPRNGSRLWLATNGSLRLSDDSGQTWRSVLPDIASDLDIDPQNSQVVYATLTDGSVMRTMDGGTTWASLTVPARAPSVGRPRLAIHPADSARLYLFGETGLFASADGGATWSRPESGIIATSPRKLLPPATASGRILFPVIGYGIHGLRPGAENIDTAILPGFAPVSGAYAPEVVALLSLPTTLVVALDDSRIAFSSNLGASWTFAATPPPAQTGSLAAATNGGLTLYATTNNGVYRSNDVGNTWSPSSNGLPSSTPVGHIAVASNQAHLYVSAQVGTGPNDVIYRSVDGGQHWSLTPTVLEKRGVIAITPHPTDTQTLLIGTNEGLFKTTDGGTTWRSLELFPGSFNSPIGTVAIDPANPDIIYVDSNGGVGNVVRSVDGGVTFQRLMPDYYDGSAAASLLVDPQANRVLAAVPGGGLRQFSVQPDLSLAVTSPSTATPGSQVEFTITATNQGPFDAAGVRVEARLPTNATVASATSNESTCTVANNVVTCAVDILRTSRAATIRVFSALASEGSFAINASVIGAQPDSASANNSAMASVSVASPANNSGSGGGGGGSFGALVALALLSLGLLKRERSSR